VLSSVACVQWAAVGYAAASHHDGVTVCCAPWLRRLPGFQPSVSDPTEPGVLALVLHAAAVPAAVLAHAEAHAWALPADGRSSGYDWRRVKKKAIKVGKSCT
jgi:hypothetical protein